MFRDFISSIALYKPEDNQDEKKNEKKDEKKMEKPAKKQVIHIWRSKLEYISIFLSFSATPVH